MSRSSGRRSGDPVKQGLRLERPRSLCILPAPTGPDTGSSSKRLCQLRETRNERIIHYLQLGHFAAVLAANLLIHVLPVAPYRASVGLGDLDGGAAAAGAQGAYPWLFLAAFSVCIHCILIVLSALRYSSEAVRWTAGPAIVLQAAIYPWLVPVEYRLPVLMVGVLALALVGAGGAYLVSDLIQLHGKAVMKDHLSRFLAPELVA